MKRILLLFALVFSLLSCSQNTVKTSGTTAMEKIASDKNFVFKAQTAYPSRSAAIQLTPGFDLQVISDSVSAYLPFYGRAYTVPISNTGGGVRIESKWSQYNVTRKKKSVEISITPKKGDDIREINMVLFENGYARVYITSNSREPISYSGTIEKK
jgi:hypothetical protein